MLHCVASLAELANSAAASTLVASSSVHCRAAAAGSIFLVSAPSFSLFAWAHRLSILAWPSSTVASPPPRRRTALAVSWRIGQGGLVLPKKFGLAVPDRTKQLVQLCSFGSLKRATAEERRASRRERSNLAYAVGFCQSRPTVRPFTHLQARPLARSPARAPFQRSLTSVLADGRR